MPKVPFNRFKKCRNKLVILLISMIFWEQSPVTTRRRKASWFPCLLIAPRRFFTITRIYLKKRAWILTIRQKPGRKLLKRVRNFENLARNAATLLLGPPGCSWKLLAPGIT